MEPLPQSKAKQLAEDYVAGNPNLKIGDVSEKDEALKPGSRPRMALWWKSCSSTSKPVG
jgi:hypothetical protein